MKTVDVRNLPPFERHPLIFNELEKIDVGESIELVNDHDPKPLLYQLQAEYGEMYDWEYTENGPTDWRVILKKVSK